MASRRSSRYNEYIHACTVCTCTCIVCTVRYFTILDLETTFDLWLEERPCLNSTIELSVGTGHTHVRGIYFTSLNILGIVPSHSFSNEKDDGSIPTTTERQLFLTWAIISPCSLHILLAHKLPIYIGRSREFRSAKSPGFLLANSGSFRFITRPDLCCAGQVGLPNCLVSLIGQNKFRK